MITEPITITAGVTMPAGTYWVGDPCYAIPQEKWMEWLEDADYINERTYLLATCYGQWCLGIGTAFGDGLFYDQAGREYPVDAGLIGVVPTGVVLPSDPDPFGMHWVEFTEPFVCQMVEEDTWEYGAGTIVIGHLAIPTGESAFEEEEEEELEYDEEVQY